MSEARGLAALGCALLAVACARSGGESRASDTTLAPSEQRVAVTSAAPSTSAPLASTTQAVAEPASSAVRVTSAAASATASSEPAASAPATRSASAVSGGKGRGAACGGGAARGGCTTGLECCMTGFRGHCGGAAPAPGEQYPPCVFTYSCEPGPCHPPALPP